MRVWKWPLLLGFCVPLAACAAEQAAPAYVPTYRAPTQAPAVTPAPSRPTITVSSGPRASLPTRAPSVAPATPAPTIAPTPAGVSFARDVAPILSARCAACHSVPGSGGVNLTDAAGTALYGDVKANISAVIAAVTAARMPLSGPPLEAAQIDVLKRWVQAGTPNN